jgi:uncharacterized protein YbaR (Trm112 family)
MSIHAKLLEVLVCPACKGPVVETRSKDAADAQPAPDAPLLGLDCQHCKLRYPIIDEIPVMLIDQAQRI